MGRHRRPLPSPARQKGVGLILALLFALAILILGGSAVRTVLMAEKMGGNMRNQSLSFQAAEAAILAAEAHLSTTMALNRTVGSGTGTGAGDYGTSAITSTSTSSNSDTGSAAFWAGFTWSKTNATAVSVSVNGVDRTAYYVIEALGTPALVNGSTATEAYRVTAYAEGGSAEAATLLQTTYTR